MFVFDVLSYGFIVVCLVIVVVFHMLCFFFKQKTAYEMRISDWSSDVCSSDLTARPLLTRDGDDAFLHKLFEPIERSDRIVRMDGGDAAWVASVPCLEDRKSVV